MFLFWVTTAFSTQRFAPAKSGMGLGLWFCDMVAVRSVCFCSISSGAQKPLWRFLVGSQPFPSVHSEGPIPTLSVIRVDRSVLL